VSGQTARHTGLSRRPRSEGSATTALSRHASIRDHDRAFMAVSRAEVLFSRPGVPRLGSGRRAHCHPPSGMPYLPTARVAPLLMDGLRRRAGRRFRIGCLRICRAPRKSVNRRPTTARTAAFKPTNPPTTPAATPAHPAAAAWGSAAAARPPVPEVPPAPAGARAGRARRLRLA
jgi:hypothetical protein